MEEKLVKRFYISLWGNTIVSIIFIVFFAIVLIVTYVDYNRGNVEFSRLIVIVVILLILIPNIILKPLIPKLRDLPAVRQRKFEKMTGTIVRYREVMLDEYTSDHRPIVKDNVTGKEIMLRIVNRESPTTYKLPFQKDEIVDFKYYGTYSFIYLKNTKLAVIEK